MVSRRKGVRIRKGWNKERGKDEKVNEESLKRHDGRKGRK